MAEPSNKTVVVKPELFNRRSKKTEKMQGSVTVEIESYSDLSAL